MRRAVFEQSAFVGCVITELVGTALLAPCHVGSVVAGPVEEKFAALADKMLLTPAADCAADIIRGLSKGSKRIITGNKSTTMFWMSRLFPNSYPALLKLLG